MDLKDALKQISGRIEGLKENLQTEEATKNALVLPFISALGYDVFNPIEVVPEMTCDIGIKKGEKIDYCIQKDGDAIILIECKHWKQDLNLHDNQLLRYFHVSNAKFGVLTNGIIYRFYTDLTEQNKMDKTPFLEVNMLDLKDSHIEELKKFHKSYFDVSSILSSASELKYMRELKMRLIDEFATPSPEFVKFFGKQIYDGQFTAKICDQFTPLLKRAISSYINEIISDRLNAAIKTEDKQVEVNTQEDNVDECENLSIVTTDEEIEAFYIVKAILAKEVDPKRIFFRDNTRYFTVIIDDNNRKNVCRLYLDSDTKKKMKIIDENREEQTIYIDDIMDLYKYSDLLISVAKRHL